ncbi:hypothetical protein AVEN_112108-1 [Araneus ventricosus]|uniref:Uncharacterized protein n=1 Tax=Araneus ventricosus TaxID=182803 RepID=A0A4Y2X9N8_ARAVE|nr:hypothetical protein AVEN_112108-1 [Araneus ventricosus]
MRKVGQIDIKPLQASITITFRLFKLCCGYEETSEDAPQLSAVLFTTPSVRCPTFIEGGNFYMWLTKAKSITLDCLRNLVQSNFKTLIGGYQYSRCWNRW